MYMRSPINPNKHIYMVHSTQSAPLNHPIMVVTGKCQTQRHNHSFTKHLRKPFTRHRTQFLLRISASRQHGFSIMCNNENNNYFTTITVINAKIMYIYVQKSLSNTHAHTQIVVMSVKLSSKQ